MSKYPCGLIEDLIPLYIEGDVNEETKEIVQEHLKECENCSSLMKEYTNDSLKSNEFVEIEDLPQSKTFKKWMRRLKIWGSVLVAAVITIAIVIGALGYRMGKDTNNNLLTLKTIVKTFKTHGLSLKEYKSKSPNDFDLNGIKPAIYSIGDNKDMLLIYTFKSFAEREQILSETKKFDNSYSLEQVPYKAKNALIVFMPSHMPKTQEDADNFGKTTSLISNTVFKYLNDGKEIIYKGENASWEGTFTLKYYEHWFQDGTGKLHYDNYSWQYPSIKYKKSDIENVGPITFKYETSSGSGESAGLTLNKEGYINDGGSGGNGAMPRENEEIKFTIKWGDKEENMVLKAQ